MLRAIIRRLALLLTLILLPYFPQPPRKPIPCSHFTFLLLPEGRSELIQRTGEEEARGVMLDRVEVRGDTSCG